MHALFRKHFMNKPEIAIMQAAKTGTGVSTRIKMGKERYRSTDQIRTIKDTCGATEDVNVVQQVHPTGLPARDHRDVLRKPLPFNLIVASLIRSHNSDFRMSFSQLNHSRQAIRCDPIICGYYFAVL